MNKGFPTAGAGAGLLLTAATNSFMPKNDKVVALSALGMIELGLYSVTYTMHQERKANRELEQANKDIAIYSLFDDVKSWKLRSSSTLSR